ncbi:hypothetical protein NEPAR07_2217 [Nematocida parisii]|uniref:Uncharacterized protein n=1 Tax=Nematocida parisii (strain ERTm3) TaxID=935791 RepID=I3EJ29_NEMP3|nr:hypothetical protein NEQG_01045 [Nematocida parisii ERTm3]KAI5146231.1 hypothetical protein NEPAR07_2217 [Nematocida parisii]
MELKIINKEWVYNILYNNHKVITGVRIFLLILCFINKIFALNHDEIEEIHELQFTNQPESEDSVVINLEGSLNVARWYIDDTTNNITNKKWLNTDNKVIMHTKDDITRMCYITESTQGIPQNQSEIDKYMKGYYRVLYTLFNWSLIRPEDKSKSKSKEDEIASSSSKYIYRTLAHLFLMTEGLYLPIEVSDSEYDDMVFMLSDSNNKYTHIRCIASYIGHKRNSKHMDSSSTYNMMYNCYCNMSEADKSENERRIIEFFIEYSDRSVIQKAFKFTEPTTREEFITGEFMNTPGFLIQNYVYITMCSVLEIKLFIEEVHALLMECIKGVSKDKAKHKETATKIFKKLFIPKKEQKRAGSVLINERGLYDLVKTMNITYERIVSNSSIITENTKLKNIFIEIQAKVNFINAASLWGLMFNDYLLFLIEIYRHQFSFPDLSRFGLSPHPSNGIKYISVIAEEYYNDISGLVLFKYVLLLNKNYKSLISALLAIAIHKNESADSRILKFIEILVLFSNKENSSTCITNQDNLNGKFPIDVYYLPVQCIAMEFIKKKRLLSNIPHRPIIHIKPVAHLDNGQYSYEIQVISDIIEYLIYKKSTDGLCYFISLCMSNFGNSWLNLVKKSENGTNVSRSSRKSGDTYDLAMHFTAGGTEVVQLTRIYDKLVKNKSDSDTLQFNPNNVSSFLTYILCRAFEDISTYENVIEKIYEIWIRTMLNEELKPVIQNISPNCPTLKIILSLLETKITKLSKNIEKNAEYIDRLSKMQEDIQAIICNIKECSYGIYKNQNIWNMYVENPGWIWNGMDEDEKKRIFDSNNDWDEINDDIDGNGDIIGGNCSNENPIGRDHLNANIDQTYNSDSSSYFASSISSLSDLSDHSDYCSTICSSRRNSNSNSVSTSECEECEECEEYDDDSKNSEDDIQHDLNIVNKISDNDDSRINCSCFYCIRDSSDSSDSSDSKKNDNIKCNPTPCGNNSIGNSKDNNSNHDVVITSININQNKSNNSRDDYSDSGNGHNAIGDVEDDNKTTCSANNSNNDRSDSSRDISDIYTDTDTDSGSSSSSSGDHNPIGDGRDDNKTTCSANDHANNSNNDRSDSYSSSNSN